MHGAGVDRACMTFRHRVIAAILGDFTAIGVAGMMLMLVVAVLVLGHVFDS